MVHKYVLLCWFLSQSLECRTFIKVYHENKCSRGRKESRNGQRVKSSYFAGLTSASANRTGSSEAKVSLQTHLHWTQMAVPAYFPVNHYTWVTSPWEVWT